MTSFHATPISVLNFSYQCNNSFNCREIKQRVKAGTYLLEVWGAQGGNTTNNNGGRGGYSFGLVSFCKSVNLHIFIGAKGVLPMPEEEYSCIIDSERSFNGGGKGSYCNDEGGLRYGASGGGATDIRVNGNGLNNRILVAGGGGGAGYGYRTHNPGGFGGGLNGGDGQSDFHQKGLGATQSHGGLQFGGGAIGQGADRPSGAASSGGGGGYYGGGSGQLTGASGGGGSGFICMDRSCGYPFIKGELRSGNDNIPDFYTGNEIQGNYGNGFARISLITTSYYCMNTMIYRTYSSKIYVFIFVLSR